MRPPFDAVGKVAFGPVVVSVVGVARNLRCAGTRRT